MVGGEAQWESKDFQNLEDKFGGRIYQYAAEQHGGQEQSQD
jgi:hypothetical protein